MAKTGKAKTVRGRERARRRKYKDYNLSSLAQHAQHKKVLTPPLKQLENFSFSSWRDEAMPQVLWAVLLAGNLDRTLYLDLFQSVARCAKAGIEDCDKTFVTHTSTSVLSDDTFDVIYADVLKSEQATSVLSSLLVFDNLPDRNHWARHLRNPDNKQAWSYLARSVALSFDHQSEAATDVRWMKYLYAAIVGRLIFSPTMKEHLEHVLNYPHSGDLRSVRPTIRAGEMSLRDPKFERSAAENIPESWHSTFWEECWLKTQCIYPELKRQPDVDLNDYLGQLFDLYKECAEHFFNTVAGTAPDARHESAIGIALYAMNIGIAVGRGNLHLRVEGRILLRTLVELFITLAFLVYKDDKTIWKQYRKYGAGQAKLSFLKYIEKQSIPEFVNVDELFAYANEDLWQEYQDINLGAWADKNLRKMAEEAGVKDTYDKYYDWPSGYIHGHWAAVRDANFTTCLNPLHRFHRVPFLPRLDMPTVIPDVGRLINRILDLMDKVYPRFKQRLKAHNVVAKSLAAPATAD